MYILEVIERNILLGDFIVETENKKRKDSRENYYLKRHIMQLTCYKNPNNLTCIDLILTNISRNINSIAVIGTGLSDFHLLSLISYEKIHLEISSQNFQLRSYRNFSDEEFRKNLKQKNCKSDICEQC